MLSDNESTIASQQSRRAEQLQLKLSRSFESFHSNSNQPGTEEAVVWRGLSFLTQNLQNSFSGLKSGEGTAHSSLWAQTWASRFKLRRPALHTLEYNLAGKYNLLSMMPGWCVCSRFRFTIWKLLRPLKYYLGPKQNSQMIGKRLLI